MNQDPFKTLRPFPLSAGGTGMHYSLPALEAAGLGNVSRLPISIRIVLESVLRNCDGKKVTVDHVRQVANWAPTAARVDEIPFVVARVVLQDFTGVPLLADLAAMRNVAKDMAHGINFPCAQVGSIAPFERRAGAAAGLFGFLLMIVAALIGVWIGASWNGTVYPLVLTVAAAALVVFVTVNFGIARPQRAAAAAEPLDAARQDRL